MLLRRFMEHIRNQNWFAVVLDIIVVVVGIFIGMQVTDWNQSRLERSREQEYLVRLGAELDGNITRLQEAASANNSLLADMSRILLILRAAEPSEEDIAFIGQRLPWTVGIWRSVLLETGTIDELLSSGDMRLLRSRDVRKALIEFREGVSRINSQLDYFRSWMLVNKNTISSGVSFVVAERPLVAASGLDRPTNVAVRPDDAGNLARLREVLETRAVDLEAVRDDAVLRGLSEIWVTRGNLVTLVNDVTRQAVHAREIIGQAQDDR